MPQVLPDAIHFMVSWLALSSGFLPMTLASASHSWCGFFWVPHLVLRSDMLDILLCPTSLMLAWFDACLACFMFFAFTVGFGWLCWFFAFTVCFGWLCWYSLTGSPGVALVPLLRPQVSLRMQFPILHLWVSSRASPTCVIFRFHCCRCLVNQLVFSQDASSRLPFTTVLSDGRQLVRTMVVVIPCLCWGTCCLLAPLPLAW